MADMIPVGEPGTIGHVPEQVARLVREMAALQRAEQAERVARTALHHAEEATKRARDRAERQAWKVGQMAMRAGWVTSELVETVRP